MAPLLDDPRYRQTWNQLSQNAESATETAAAGIWTFQHTYIQPCLSSLAQAVDQCTGTCLPDREERARRFRERGRSRGRAEQSFDFYDDWDEDDDGGRGRGLWGGWGHDELDRLLAGSGSQSGAVDHAPRRTRGMSYGTRGVRRKSLEPDPTVIPSTRALGFLGRLPFRWGGTLRYRPSAADLQDHPGASRSAYGDEEGVPLLSDEDSEGEGEGRRAKAARNRSGTASSGETTNSMRSRRDLFPSDGEDDAVPLSDEFAMVLERRMTNTDDRSSGKTRASAGPRAPGSRTASRALSRTTHSSPSRRSTPQAGGSRSRSRTESPEVPSPGVADTPSLADLRQEEPRARHEDELAPERGLRSRAAPDPPSEAKIEPPQLEDPPTLLVVGTPGPPRADDMASRSAPATASGPRASAGFVPARLPHFT